MRMDAQINGCDLSLSFPFSDTVSSGVIPVRGSESEVMSYFPRVNVVMILEAGCI